MLSKIKYSLLGAAIFMAPYLFAVEGDGGAQHYGMSLSEAWACGGKIMWILLALSVVAVALVLYFFITLRQGVLVPRRLRLDVSEAIDGGDYTKARRLCEDKFCAFSAVTLAALENVDAFGKVQDAQFLRDSVASEGIRQTEGMMSQVQLLLDLSAIAPMLGLLGTTIGMLSAFGSIAEDVTAAAKPVILAQGVSQAIVTTIFGLVVAIPCLAFYAYFRRRAAGLTSFLERSATSLLSSLLFNKVGEKK